METVALTLAQWTAVDKKHAGALLRRGIAKDLLTLIKNPPGPKFFRRAFLATVQSLRAMAESGSVGVHLKALADPAAWMTLLGYIENPKIAAGVLASVVPEFLDFTAIILSHKQTPLLLGIDTAAGIRVLSRVLLDSVRYPVLLAKTITVLTLLLHMSRGVVDARTAIDLRVVKFVRTHTSTSQIGSSLFDEVTSFFFLFGFPFVVVSPR